MTLAWSPRVFAIVCFYRRCYTPDGHFCVSVLKTSARRRLSAKRTCLSRRAVSRCPPRLRGSHSAPPLCRPPRDSAAHCTCNPSIIARVATAALRGACCDPRWRSSDPVDAADAAQTVERMRAGDLMDQVEVDVDEVRLADLSFDHEVVIPDLLCESARLRRACVITHFPVPRSCSSATASRARSSTDHRRRCIAGPR